MITESSDLGDMMMRHERMLLQSFTRIGIVAQTHQPGRVAALASYVSTFLQTDTPRSLSPMPVAFFGWYIPTPDPIMQCSLRVVVVCSTTGAAYWQNALGSTAESWLVPQSVKSSTQRHEGMGSRVWLVRPECISVYASIVKQYRVRPSRVVVHDSHVLCRDMEGHGTARDRSSGDRDYVCWGIPVGDFTWVVNPLIRTTRGLTSQRSVSRWGLWHHLKLLEENQYGALVVGTGRAIDVLDVPLPQTTINVEDRPVRVYGKRMRCLDALERCGRRVRVEPPWKEGEGGQARPRSMKACSWKRYVSSAQNTCSICIDESVAGGVCIMGCCGKVMCLECSSRYFSSRKVERCAMCRQVVDSVFVTTTAKDVEDHEGGETGIHSVVPGVIEDCLVEGLSRGRDMVLVVTDRDTARTLRQAMCPTPFVEIRGTCPQRRRILQSISERRESPLVVIAQSLSVAGNLFEEPRLAGVVVDHPLAYGVSAYTGGLDVRVRVVRVTGIKR